MLKKTVSVGWLKVRQTFIEYYSFEMRASNSGCSGPIGGGNCHWATQTFLYGVLQFGPAFRGRYD
jgi:hypothetical protein